MENSCLAGEDGRTTYEKGSGGLPLPGTTVTKPAKDGGDVVLTLDKDIQWFSQQSLAAQAQEVGASWGVVTVMEVKTGKLLAVAEYPAVDPNNITRRRPRTAAHGPSRPRSNRDRRTSRSPPPHSSIRASRTPTPRWSLRSGTSPRTVPTSTTASSTRT